MIRLNMAAHSWTWLGIRVSGARNSRPPSRNEVMETCRDLLAEPGQEDLQTCLGSGTLCSSCWAAWRTPPPQPVRPVETLERVSRQPLRAFVVDRYSLVRKQTREDAGSGSGVCAVSSPSPGWGGAQNNLPSYRYAASILRRRPGLARRAFVWPRLNQAAACRRGSRGTGGGRRPCW